MKLPIPKGAEYEKNILHQTSELNNLYVYVTSSKVVVGLIFIGFSTIYDVSKMAQNCNDSRIGNKYRKIK